MRLSSWNSIMKETLNKFPIWKCPFFSYLPTYRNITLFSLTPSFQCKKTLLTKPNEVIFGGICSLSLILTLASRQRSFFCVSAVKRKLFSRLVKKYLLVLELKYDEWWKETFALLLSKTSGSTGRDVGYGLNLISKKNFHR